MKVTLLIITYNWPEALRMVLESAMHQSKMPEKLLLAMMDLQRKRSCLLKVTLSLRLYRLCMYGRKIRDSAVLSF